MTLVSFPSRGKPSCAGKSGVMSVATQQPDQPALYLDPLGAENPRLVGLVGRLERDRPAAPAQPFESYLDIVDQSDDNLAVFGRLAALDHNRVAIENARFGHAVARDLERVMLAAPDQVAWDRNRGILIAQLLDRRTDVDPAFHLQVHRHAFRRHRHSRQRGGKSPANYRRREAPALCSARRSTRRRSG